MVKALGVRENLTKEGAERLAREIREYWYRRGIAPDVWVEKAEGAELWGVRSNLDVQAVKLEV
jgi:hypothetical protein